MTPEQAAEELRELQRRERTRPLADWELRRYKRTRRAMARVAAQSIGLQMPRKR